MSAEIAFETVAARFWKKIISENEHCDPFIIAILMTSYDTFLFTVQTIVKIKRFGLYVYQMDYL